jgi:hypothetical protein
MMVVETPPHNESYVHVENVIENENEIVMIVSCEL